MVAGLLLSAGAGAALADAPDVKVVLTAKRVVVENARETLVDAAKAQPGELIQYEATYRNDGKAPVKGVGATVPIPQGMSFLSESAQPGDAQASLDGKTFSKIPLMREVKNAAGAIEKQPVPPSQYRAVRWNLPELAGGQSAVVSLRARVLTNSAGE